MFELHQSRHRRILIQPQDSFFSHLLGSYWGTPLRVGPSDFHNYRVCVYAGSEPDPKKRPVLQLDLDERRGLYDAGLHWSILVQDLQRSGDAWDDNRPEPLAVPYPFEEWVLDRIADLIQVLAREQLHVLMEAVALPEGMSREDWLSLQASALDIHDHMRSSNRDLSRLSGLVLAHCAIALEDMNGARKLVERFSWDLCWSEMIRGEVQALVGPLLGHWEKLWCRRLKIPMKQLVRLDRTREQMEFHLWLVKCNQTSLVKNWALVLKGNEKRVDLLTWHAGQMNPSTMADSAIVLIKQAIKLKGETSDLLALLSAMLWSSGQERRAAMVDTRLKSVGFELGIQGQIEEYLMIHNRIAAHQRKTGRIPLSERVAVARVMELENLLNLHWSAEPIRAAARQRDLMENPGIPVPGRVDVLDRLISEHRFVCGGSVLWVSMWRDERQYRHAMHRMKEVFSDWELVRLIYASNKPSLEVLLNNGCGALLDSPDPGALPLAHRITIRALAELPEPELSDLNYSYACVFARSGDVESALERLRRCLDAGESRSVIRGDSDFDLIRENDRFEALLAS